MPEWTVELECDEVTHEWSGRALHLASGTRFQSRRMSPVRVMQDLGDRITAHEIGYVRQARRAVRQRDAQRFRFKG